MRPTTGRTPGRHGASSARARAANCRATTSAWRSTPNTDARRTSFTSMWTVCGSMCERLYRRMPTRSARGGRRFRSHLPATTTWRCGWRSPSLGRSIRSTCWRMACQERGTTWDDTPSWRSVTQPASCCSPAVPIPCEPRLRRGTTGPRLRRGITVAQPVRRAAGAASGAGTEAASAASISPKERPRVSKPINQKAAAPSTYQKAK
jgi:hypothetical protein